MSGRDAKKTDEEGNGKRKSDTAQSCWKLKKKREEKKKVSTVVQYYKCNSGLSSILWSWQSNSESVWTGWRLSMLSLI